MNDLFVRFMPYSTVNSLGHVRTTSYLTTLFLGKPPGGILPVLSGHSFASNRQIPLLESVEEGNCFHFPQKNR